MEQEYRRDRCRDTIHFFYLIILVIAANVKAIARWVFAEREKMRRCMIENE